jgi:ABC-type dipeptide/oligopeptide/nickel transport system permease component
MIPTLFGITVVSFCIMQLAPGDPAASQLSGGTVGRGGETPEMYQERKRELHLDKPLLLNFNYFRDFRRTIQLSAFYLSRTDAEILSDLKLLAEASKDSKPRPEAAERLKFLRSVGIPDFDSRLADRDRWPTLPNLIEYYVGKLCGDLGTAAVRPAIDILQDSASSARLKIGAIHCLTRMVGQPFDYTYSLPPSDSQTPAVSLPWRIWWDRNKATLPRPSAEANAYFRDSMKRMVKSHDEFNRAIMDIGGSKKYYSMARYYFAETLLGDSPLDQKVAASAILKQLVAEPLKMDLANDASTKQIDEVTANWLEHYKLNQRDYEPSALIRVWRIVADTQYAYMVVRLVTFQFGNSTIHTHEPVITMIWNALVVSAPLMFMSELLIYLIAVPLGIVCGVNRGKPLDKGISLGLFVLYSIPPFVAGMLFLVFLCYGDYLNWFPALGLHSSNASSLSFFPYLWDYFRHAFLPIVCLSLFSLAAMAMYARSSLLDVINQDYIRTARAKGLSGPVVILKHAMRNALIPILTLFSTFLPAMLGGAVLIEYLFGIPGMGELGFTSIDQKDFPTLMALLYVEALVTLVSFLITDILYVVVDPRITFGARGDSA